MTTDGNFVDAEQYQGEGVEKLSFRSIILEHLRNIAKYSSVEFRGGYFENKLVGSHGASQQVYVPDSRDVYINAVDVLSDMLYPHFDDELKQAEEVLNQELSDTYQKYRKGVNDDELSQESLHQQWRFDKLSLKRKLFRHICSFLYRKKYLELGSFEE